MILSDYENTSSKEKNRENNYLPSMNFLQKIPIQNCFWADVFNCQPIFKILQHILRQTKRRIFCKENILPKNKSDRDM